MTEDRQTTLHNEHLECVFANQNGVGVYALPTTIPTTQGCADEREFIVFKIISLHPDRRSYLQRAFALASDDALSAV